MFKFFTGSVRLKLQLNDAICRIRFYSNSLIHMLSLSNSHNNVASSIQKNRADKSHPVKATSQGYFSLKATVIRCDLSPRFFCVDATLLCQFESDKI